MYLYETDIDSEEFERAEEVLSEMFDEMLKDSNFFDTYSYDDEIAINEEFSYLADSMCKDGSLSEEQYNNYEYIGRFSK